MFEKLHEKLGETLNIKVEVLDEREEKHFNKLSSEKLGNVEA